ncbi:MAG TPA: c-type cytochrome, methanol metabolism-related [Methylomirabilota bacterium]|nr:c-type cytochrome, methanol metabolism-related [Methylomirabilota bacterium]
MVMATVRFPSGALAIGAAIGLALAVLAGSGPAAAQDAAKPYSVAPDGTVSWPVYSGYRRYHSDCHVCHGPDGMGSSFAPALVDSLKHLSYDQFIDTVTNGKKDVSTSSDKVMPSFGVNPNVMCFIDDIYAYLKARSDGAIGRGRPEKHEDKSAEAKAREDNCLGTQ